MLIGIDTCMIYDEKSNSEMQFVAQVYFWHPLKPPPFMAWEASVVGLGCRLEIVSMMLRGQLRFIVFFSFFVL